MGRLRVKFGYAIKNLHIRTQNVRGQAEEVLIFQGSFSHFRLIKLYPGYQRFFSRAAGIFCWPKADTSSAVGRSYERRTGNRARKVSGTQGNQALKRFLFFRGCASHSVTIGRNIVQLIHNGKQSRSKKNINPFLYFLNKVLRFLIIYFARQLYGKHFQ